MTCGVDGALAMRDDTALLRAVDPQPVDIVNFHSAEPVVLVCEHAGRAIPNTLGNLGLNALQLKQHIAYDIGAENVARRMSELLNVPLVLQPYSRLIIDCNRPLDAPDSIPAISDGVQIPGNEGLSDWHRQLRIDEVFEPFDSAIASIMEAHPRNAAFAIHSFTKQLEGGEPRPWDIGLCFRQDLTTAHSLAASIGKADPSLMIGLNEPYRIEDSSDWFLPVHCEPRKLAHCLIEIRNDLLTTTAACDRMASMLASSISAVLDAAS